MESSKSTSNLFISNSKASASQLPQSRSFQPESSGHSSSIRKTLPSSFSKIKALCQKKPVFSASSSTQSLITPSLDEKPSEVLSTLEGSRSDHTLVTLHSKSLKWKPANDSSEAYMYTGLPQRTCSDETEYFTNIWRQSFNPKSINQQTIVDLQTENEALSVAKDIVETELLEAIACHKSNDDTEKLCQAYRDLALHHLNTGAKARAMKIYESVCALSFDIELIQKVIDYHRLYESDILHMKAQIRLFYIHLHHDSKNFEAYGTYQRYLRAYGLDAEAKKIRELFDAAKHDIPTTSAGKLHEAIKTHALKDVYKLSSNGNILNEIYDKTMPLNEGIRSGSASIVKRLLKSGADLYMHPNQRDSSLHIAAGMTSIEVVSVLLKAGEPLEAKNIEGYTPLHIAAIRGSAEMIQTLREAGANLESTDKYKSTPLFIAACYGNTQAVERLILDGACMTAKDNHGRSPMHIAVLQNHMSICKELIDRGAPIDVPDEMGRTPLYFATLSDNIKCVEYLLSKGADWSLSDNNGENPLSLACHQGNPLMIRAFNYKADAMHTQPKLDL